MGWVVKPPAAVRAQAGASCPGPAAADQAEGEQAAQVQRRDAVVQPQIVAPGPDEPQPPVAAGDQPGDRAFDHGPVLAVDGLELGISGAGSVRALQRVVRMQPQRAAAGRGGAAGPQRAVRGSAPRRPPCGCG